MITQLFIRLIKVLPFSTRSSLGWWIGWIVGLIPLRDQKIAKAQVQSILREASPGALVRKVYAHFASVGFECVDLGPAIRSHASFIEAEDPALFKRLQQLDRPIVALTAHFGNWELLAAYMSALGVEVVTVAREARKATLQQFLRHERERFGIQTIWRGGASAQKELIQALRDGKTVAALIDQDTYVSGVSSEFFGVHVKTPSALVELARRNDAQIVTAFNYRRKDGRYCVRIREISSLLPLEETLHQYHLHLEEVVREYPEQWVWFHKRWRSLPDGSRLSSSDYLAYLQGDAFRTDSSMSNSDDSKSSVSP